MTKTSLWRSLVGARMWAVFLLGLSSGLPFLLTGGTLKAWMKDARVDLTTIGIFSLVGLPYALKFLWAPVMDRYQAPLLDRRRGWILVFQIGLAAALALLALVNPADEPWLAAACAGLVAWMSASQDIAIDAYRREILSDSELSLGSSLAVNGYRIGMLVAGAGALALADQINWNEVYFVMAGVMLLTTLVTFMAPAPTAVARAPVTLKEAVVGPFLEYFRRNAAIEMLVFILLYKLGESMASDMLNPFYLDLGFTKTEVAAVAKVFGFWATIVGGLLGGALILRLGLIKALWLFGILQSVCLLGFTVVANIGKDLTALGLAIGAENLTSGMATSAYVGFMASLCNKRFTATQYALLSSIIGIPRVILGSSSGYFAKMLGWGPYFIFCAVLTVPGLLLLLRARRWPQVNQE